MIKLFFFLGINFIVVIIFINSVRAWVAFTDPTSEQITERLNALYHIDRDFGVRFFCRPHESHRPAVRRAVESPVAVDVQVFPQHRLTSPVTSATGGRLERDSRRSSSSNPKLLRRTARRLDRRNGHFLLELGTYKNPIDRCNYCCNTRMLVGKANFYCT